MKRNALCKLISLALALVVTLALPIQALADSYDLAEGSVTVNASGSGQTVTHKSETKQDSNPVIKQSNNETSTQNTITIKSEGNATAKVTIENVNISTSSGSGINVTDGSKAKVTVQGENTVKTEDRSSAAVHMGSGELTITGGKEDKLTAENSSSGAGIGSNSYEPMTGKITIQGDLTVDASSGLGAGIGSGRNGAMTDDSSISIQDNAQVRAKSESGAGIGGGVFGNMDGSITIGGNAGVTAEGYSGAGIGSGNGGVMGGSISIQDNATVTANGRYGAGIGSGGWGNVSGAVSISGDASVTAGSSYGASIGAGVPSYYEGNFQEEASIEIKDNANVTVHEKNYSASVIGDGFIGAKNPDKSKGSFEIDSTAKLNGENITDLEQLRGKYGLDVDSGKITVNVIPTPDTKPGEHGGEEYKPGMSLYWVTDESGKGVTSKVSRKDSVMTVTAELENASFVTTQWGLSELGKQGVKTITFVTSGATSSFDVGEALENLDSGNLVLTHKGGDATLTLGGVEHNELLK